MNEETLIELGVVSEETMGIPVFDRCEQILNPAGTGSDYRELLCLWT